MPTSATGTSNKALRPAAAAPGPRGFTLLEVLVVLVIIGIITSMAVVSTRVLGGDHEMDQEAERLYAVLVQAREDAMLEGRDVALRIDARGYDFLRLDRRTGLWDLVVDDPLLRERTLPEGLEAALWLESQPVRLGARNAPSERTPAMPQVIVQASGELVPFELVLTRAGTEERRRVSGAIDGTIELGRIDDAPGT